MTAIGRVYGLVVCNKGTTVYSASVPPRTATRRKLLPGSFQRTIDARLTRGWNGLAVRNKGMRDKLVEVLLMGLRTPERLEKVAHCGTLFCRLWTFIYLINSICVWGECNGVEALLNKIRLCKCFKRFWRYILSLLEDRCPCRRDLWPRRSCARSFVLWLQKMYDYRKLEIDFFEVCECT